ncbi:hypothetical protein BC834DRAFT_987866 [Gloeopeniophorella convolvens]|nr:hypothetical protein BC834DRAFT_987866 [Gloeopeniophorella convolvens]
MVKDGARTSDAGADRALNVIGDNVSVLQGAVTSFMPMAPVAAAALSAVVQTDLGKSVQDGIEHFFEGMPVLMNALDAVAGLHPFVGVVVMAFKAVYTLELKRRDNEKKIIALYVEMKDMMGVLLQLRDVRDDEVVAPGQVSLEDRLGSLVSRTADDIKQCSNACDTYAKKKLLAKVFQGPMWDAKLLSFVSLFTKRRTDFEFASRSILRWVSTKRMSSSTRGHDDKGLDDKFDEHHALPVQQFVSPEQRQLTEVVAARGGVKAFRDDDKALRSLRPCSPAHPGVPPPVTAHVGRDHRLVAGGAVGGAVRGSAECDERNLVVFTRKFEVQKRQIIDELTFVVKRESDRIVQEVKTGPHDRVRDQTIHEIWKEMAWRGNVKARHFVLALRDHFLDKIGEGHGSTATSIHESLDPDAWAIAYIDVLHLQPIMEAFDDDASGFITITEMNRFTRSRPLNWSLPHWVAYWAAGWHVSVVDYAEKIEALFAKMDGINSEILAPNREFVVQHQNLVFHNIYPLTVGVARPPPEMHPKFTEYIQAEEARLATNLKAVDYVIDGVDTLKLVTGEGRVEKTLFPLLYLLLKHHFEIMRIARKKILHGDELNANANTLSIVIYAMNERIRDLTNIFQQQKQNPERHFKSFAFGMFQHLAKPEDLWMTNQMRELDSPITPYNDEYEQQDVKIEDVLKYPSKDEVTLAEWVYDGHPIDEVPSTGGIPSPLKHIVGHWNGYYFNAEGAFETEGHDTMISIVLQPSGEDAHEFKGTALSNRGTYTLTGTWSQDADELIHVEMKLMIPTAAETSYPLYFNGHFEPEKPALVGIWGMTPDPLDFSGQMEWRKIPAYYYPHYPSQQARAQNKAKALWAFAISAVLEDVRRARWVWPYFKERGDRRRRFVELLVRFLYFGEPLGGEEDQELARIAHNFTPADACFYHSITVRIRANTYLHGGVWCDSCRGTIGGVRNMCMDCTSNGMWGSVDLDDSPTCLALEEVHHGEEVIPHKSTHRLLRMHTPVTTRQTGPVYKAAKRALEKVAPVCARLAARNKDSHGVLAPPDSSNAPDAHAPAESSVQETPQAETAASQDDDVPTCGRCKKPVSLPCWYCIFCEDDLYICASCEVEGAPDLERASGRHTEDHHLVRCQEPSEEEKAATTEQRLALLEQRFDDMRGTMDTRFNELAGRIGQIEVLLRRLAEVHLTPPPHVA